MSTIDTRTLNRCFPCLLLLLSSFLTSTAQDEDPDLLVYEGFNYEVGSSVEFLNGGTGWSGPWLWRNNFDGKGIVLQDATTVVAGSLLYGDLESSGNSLYMSGESGTLELGRGLAALITGEPGSRTYISFLAQRVGPKMDTTVPGYQWGSNPYPRGASLRFWDTSNGEQLSIGNVSNQPVDEWTVYGQGLLNPSGRSFSGAVSLVVARVEHLGDETVNDNLYLWVDPDLSLEEEIARADLTIIGSVTPRDDNTEPLDFTDLSWISPFAGGEGGGRLHAEWHIDEIRIGRTYSSVTPTFPRWSRFLMHDESTTNTGRFLKWINVDFQPWIWSYGLQTWIFATEDRVTREGSWVYLADINPGQVPGDGESSWGSYAVLVDGSAFTGNFLQWVFVGNKPWIWSYSLDTWLYLPEDRIVSGGLSLAYILDQNVQYIPLSKATKPLPEDGNGHVNGDAVSVELSWRAGSSATTHDVYFGIDKEEVGQAQPGSDYFLGNQTDNRITIQDPSNLDTYYWRVDERDDLGNLVRGDVWTFRTRHLAFPGAEGYGRFARGGRGGRVITVTNLNDSGPGSLRAALETEGPRVVVFNISGLITLESEIVINDQELTIAGQTAPGWGICIRKHKLGLSGAEDVIIRFLRVRPGDIAGITLDGMGMSGSDHCIMDHCSISWAIDEVFSSRSAKNITLQRTLISEGLNAAGHKNYPPGSEHGYAASISGLIGSFHHNLLAHCAGRNWSLAGGLDPTGRHTGWLDIRNNVVYNWKHRTTDGGAEKVNFVANYYKPGAASRYFRFLNPERNPGFGPQDYFVEGNVMEGRVGPENQLEGITEPEPYENFLVDEPFFEPHVVTQSAIDAYKVVLSDVGVNAPSLDPHDERVIIETLDGTTTYNGSYTGLPGIPDSQEDVGGWDDYPELSRPDGWDTDWDGLPNWWEDLAGTDPQSAAEDFSDSNADPDGDGYTRLDDYLSWMALPRFACEPGGSVDIDLSDLARGFREDPEFTLLDSSDGTFEPAGGGTVFRFVPTDGFEGITTVRFSVMDSEGSSMDREIGIRVLAE